VLEYIGSKPDVSGQGLHMFFIAVCCRSEKNS